MGYPVQELVNEYPNIRIRIVKKIEQFIAEGYNAAVVYKSCEYQSGDIVEGYINGDEPYHTENIEDNEYFLFIVEGGSSPEALEHDADFDLFARKISEIIENEEEFRVILKEEVLKQFDGDYNVLVSQFINNENPNAA